MQDSKFGEHLYLTPRVPQGLAAAVEGLTREVIRHRPENIYAFAARHFENLLRLREQYDDDADKKPSCSKQQQLHEVTEAVRERYDDVNKEDEDRAKGQHQSGWSLNETAKVLEKHRSIFGDSGQKVSTEQIRELANEPALTSSPKRKVERANEDRRKDSPACRTAPRILSQIPIAKDIKTELRRNRISSRERKKVVACEYTRETIIEKSSKKSIEKTKKSYEVRKSSRTETTSKSRTNSHEEKKFTRAASMDSVRNYVVQNLVGMTSLDELQSPSYVEKVQEVIDETASLIKEKVEALRSGAAARATAAKQSKKDASSEDQLSKSSSNGEGRLSSRRNSKNEDVSEASSLPAVRPPSSKSTTSARSLSSARSEPDAGGLTLPPISPESTKSPKDKKEELVLPVLSPPRTAAASVEDVEDDTTAAVEEIAEDATLSSEKIIEDDKVVEKIETTEENAEEKIEAATDEENLVLTEAKIDESVAEMVVPFESAEEKIEVPPEEAATAEENLVLTEAKTDESVAEIVVPSEEKLVPPAEVADERPAVPPIEINDEEDVQAAVVTQQVHEETVSTSTEVISHEKVEEFISIEKQVSSSEQEEEASPMDLLVVKEEEFHDSLNVTPEPFDTQGQRPDSLENSLAEEAAANSSGHASPLETTTTTLLRDKLVEIEEAQRRIEDVLDETKTSGAAKIEDKLIEIQESERRIEQILDAQSSTTGSVANNSDIKAKLQELEDAERRIESIFAKEAQEAPKIEVKESDAVGIEHEEEPSERKVETNENLSVPSTIDPESPSRAISPHSYILTEGSPYEIPASVTTVIIPERTPSPDSETLRVEVEDGKVLVTSSMNEAFGEAVTAESAEAPSTVDIEYIRGIKASHDMIVSRGENLDRIKEEEVIDSEDERVLRVVTSSLEEILEKEEVEYMQVQQQQLVEEEEEEEKLESTTTATTTSTEVKETSVTTDSLSLDAALLLPQVPELNLDSLPDLTISSSLNVTTTESPADEKREEAEEQPVADSDTETTQEFEKLEERLQTAASDIGVPAAADINNVVGARGQQVKEEEEDAATAAKESENNARSQCTIEPTTTTTTSGSIDANEGESSAIGESDEKKAYHIYVPEASASKDASSSSGTSTFMSAATKIQAGVRGFLTRRRLQSTQKRSSTLDSVPSIQESFAVETSAPSLMPIVETAASMSEAKARKKLRREDAVQRTTLSVENAFAENQLQHTGEFHDCIPLPVFDAAALSLKSMKERQKAKVNEVEHLLEKILLGHAATNFAAHPKLVDVVLLPAADAELQNKYLNFITSVEDVFGGDLPETRTTTKGVIIEEITSSLDEETSDKKDEEATTTTLASISTSEDPLSINIDEVLGLGDEDEAAASRKSRLDPAAVKLSVDQIRSGGVSQDSPVMSDERTRSPVTMMQIAPRSVDDKSEENPT